MARDPITGEEIDESGVPLFSRTLPAGASEEDKDIALSGMLSAVNSGQDDVINAPDKGDLVASYGDLNAPIQSRLNTGRNLNKEIQDITNERTVLGRDLLEPSKLRGSEALGLTVSSVLPILIGAALQGRKGALAGAQAGFGGAAVGVKGLEEEAKEADKIKSEQFKDLGLLRREKLKQASANEEAIADYQGTLARDSLTAKRAEDSQEALARRLDDRLKFESEKQTRDQQFKLEHPELFGSGLDRIVPPDVKQTLKSQLLSLGFSEQEAESGSNTNRQFQTLIGSKKAESNIADSNRRAANYQRAIDSTNFGDVKPVAPVTEKQRTEVFKAMQTWGGVAKPMNDLMKSYIKNGYSFFGQDAADNKSNFNAMIGAIKNIEGYGAALTGTELGRIIGQLPPDPSETDISNALKSLGQGVQPARLLKNVYDRLLLKTKNSVELNNYKFADLANYMGRAVSPDLLPLIYRTDPQNPNRVGVYQRVQGGKPTLIGVIE